MNSKEAEKKCICKECPSYVKCSESITFCFNGKSKCIKEKLGCLCPGCSVHKQMNFKEIYYCFIGKDKNIK